MLATLATLDWVSGDAYGLVGRSTWQRPFQKGTGKFSGTGLRKGTRNINKLRNAARPPGEDRRDRGLDA